MCLVDLSTPDTDWQSVHHCYYLSVSDQNALDYHIGSLIPYKRQNARRLPFIIEAGGDVVFDTDDDIFRPQGNHWYSHC